jgi:hypothetical protein
MSDLFVRLMKLTNQGENFFTECLAATLQADATLARKFLARLCGQELVDSARIADSGLEIKTQVTFGNSTPDMLFCFGNHPAIAVENKLASPLGEGQLEKYLNLPVGHVALIAGYEVDVPKCAREAPRYLQPREGRSHFMWHDFYPDVESCAGKPLASVLTKALLALFAQLGYEPAPACIPDLYFPDEESRKRNRLRFAKYWEATRQELMKRGWEKITAGQIVELYVKDGKAKRLKWAWIDPINLRGSLRVRLRLRDRVDPQAVVRDLRSPDFPYYEQANISLEEVKRPQTHVVIDVSVSQRKLLEGVSSAESIVQKLSDFVLAVFDRVA